MVSVSQRDYYEVLGVGRSASQQEIKSGLTESWRSSCTRIRTREIRRPKRPSRKRRQPTPSSATPTKGPSTINTATPASKAAPPSIRTFFANFPISSVEVSSKTSSASATCSEAAADRGARSDEASDFRYDLQITFEEAIKGTETRIRIPRTENCPECVGSGAAPGTGKTACTTCDGRGNIRYQQGFLVVSRSCGRCHGTGQIIPNPCKECSGVGQVQRDRELSIKIPAGVDSGSRLRLAGEGEPGTRGGPAGDLYVFLEVEEHSFFWAPRRRHLLRNPRYVCSSRARGGDRSAYYQRKRASLRSGRHPDGNDLQAQGKGSPPASRAWSWKPVRRSSRSHTDRADQRTASAPRSARRADSPSDGYCGRRRERQGASLESSSAPKNPVSVTAASFPDPQRSYPSLLLNGTTEAIDAVIGELFEEGCLGTETIDGATRQRAYFPRGNQSERLGRQIGLWVPETSHRTDRDARRARLGGSLTEGHEWVRPRRALLRVPIMGDTSRCCRDEPHGVEDRSPASVRNGSSRYHQALPWSS